MQQNVLFHDFTPKPKMTIAEFRDFCESTEAMGAKPPSLQTVVNLIEEGRLRAVKTAGAKSRWLLFKDSVQEYLQELEAAA